MPREPPVHLLTPRLLLREYVPGDLPALIAYQSEPRSREFDAPGEATPAQAAALLQLFLGWAEESPRRNVQLAIALRTNPEVVVGSCGLRMGSLPAGQAEFGLELAPACWGRGYASEAASALLAHGFHEMGLHEVIGVSVSANARVGALVRRLGFSEAGTREGAEWMEAQGWRHTLWHLPRSRWTDALTHPRGDDSFGPMSDPSLPPIRARRLTSGDETLAGELFVLMGEVFEEASTPLDEARLTDLLARPGFWAFAAFAGEALAGGLTAHTLPMTRGPSSEVFIYDLAVHPAHQRRGVGRRLMTALREAALAEGISVVFVGADDADTHAIDFYRAVGGNASPVTVFTFDDDDAETDG